MAEKKDVKKRLKADILKLEKKKASYYKKIDEITSRSEAAE
jgi:chromosome segregation ATPase